jgi:hypothetical protein
MTDIAFDDFDMAAARAKFSAKVDGRRAARKARQKKTAEAVDGRSLRATGRTEHLNFKATLRIKEALTKYVPKGKTSLWLEEAIIEKLKREGIDLDA